MNKPRFTFTIAVICGLWLAAPVLAAESEESTAPPSVETIVEKANHAAYYQGADGRAKVTMTIHDSQGRTRNREFIILRWDEPKEGSDVPKKEQSYDGEQKFYVYFQRPADVNKMVFMVWKHLESNDDRWLYMPALDLVKRIAAADKRTSFVGSHFLYEDVSGRHIDEDIHELQDVTENYYVLKNTPKRPGSVEFAHYVNYIHKETFLVVKTEYYDEQGNNYRSYQALKVEHINGYPTVTKSRMEDKKMGGFTELSYSDVEYNIGIPENVFTERYLRRAPYQYLR